MAGRKKVFDAARRRDCYMALDGDGKLIANLVDIHAVMRELYEGRGSVPSVLIHLLGHAPISQKNLTDQLGIQPASVSEVLLRMEEAGLIRRSPSEEDLRTMDIRLTEKGRAEAEAARTARRMRHRDMFSCLTESEKAQLLGLLETINEDWSVRYS